MMKQRINWIDWAKSICMFLVIIGHTHIQYPDFYTKQLIYAFHMPLFFFLSGLFGKKGLSIDSIYSDIRYIIIPYLFYSIIGIILPHPIAIKEIPQYLLNIIWGNDISIGAIWFLPAIFFCKLFGGLIISLKDKYHLFYYFLFILAFLPAFFLRGVYLPLFIGAAACGLPFFLLGNEFMKLSYKRIHGKYLLIIAFIAAIFTIVLSPMHDFVLIAANNYLYYINAFTGIIAIISTSIILNRYTIRFVTITAYGNIATLWLHGVILSLFNYYLPKMLGYDISAYPLLNAIIYSMITYALCYIFIIVADKYCPTPFGLRGRL